MYGLSSLLTNLSLFGIFLFVINLKDCIRSTLVKFCLGVLGGFAQRQVEIPMKVSRSLLTKLLMNITTAHTRSFGDLLSL